MDYKEKYEQALNRVKTFNQRWEGIKINSELALQELKEIFPELKESEDERIRKDLIRYLNTDMNENPSQSDSFYNKCIAWLEKQGEQKEINLVEILKHYPRETELYSPLYGKLWLAEVDEGHEIITCYKYPLEEDCTRAVLEQEDTVSFYSNGTTGLPDFSVSKDCMLFLYNNEKQGKQNSVWSEEDEKNYNTILKIIRNSVTSAQLANKLSDWLQSLKQRMKGE